MERVSLIINASLPISPKTKKIYFHFVLQSAFYLIVLPRIQNLYMEVGISKRQPVSFITGLVFLCLALLIFIFSCSGQNENARGVCFLMTHFLLVIYFFWLWAGGHLKPNPHRRKVTAIFVILLLVDAYTVNNTMTVFQSTTPWFAIILVAMCANILAFCFFDQWPEWGKCLQCAVLGFTLLAPVYLACYLLMMYIVSLIGLILFGISIVTFSPIFVLWFNFRMVQNLVWPVFRYRFIYLATLGLSAAIIITYGALYAVNLRAIEDVYRDGKDAHGLPAWIKVAQQLPQGSLTEMILKTNLVYMVPEFGDFGFMKTPKREYDSEVKHDPLFTASSFLFGATTIPEVERMKVLNVIYDKRHFSEDHLWSGKDLATTKVSTTADLWPRYHLAYTENTVTVANESQKSWPQNGEAIYTFHLPEGSVVTSLSLWIDGQERKGILTTKQKAQAAYHYIVGVQYRDPSVVHWQEGNRVVVRVFPVPLHGDRQFKIGITSPLLVKDGQLVYQPTWFEGPAHDHADYEVMLNMNSWPKEMSLPSGFHTGKGKSITRKGSYAADWELKIPDETMDNAAFSFNGQRYTLLPYTPAYEFFTPENYYLDVNNSWHYKDYQQIVSQLKGKAVWVFHPQKGMTAVTDNNKEQLFDELQQLRFSLFPFHHIKNAGSAIVITSTENISPQLGDLEEASFRDSLRAFFAQQPVRLYDIGHTLSPYLATLKESRSLIYEKGTTAQLLSQLDKNSFLKPKEGSTQLIMAQAGMRIIRSADSTLTPGPDHLARLFAYNQVMQQLGQRVTDKDLSNDSTLIDVAKQAYVVSPLSSLIVLETQVDYDEFNIRDDAGSLKSAALQGHGAVPEPHEWALFIISMLLLAYVRFEKLLFRKKNSIC
jgi:XrtN system VIT domain protein